MTTRNKLLYFFRSIQIIGIAGIVYSAWGISNAIKLASPEAPCKLLYIGSCSGPFYPSISEGEHTYLNVNECQVNIDGKWVIRNTTKPRWNCEP